MKDRVFIDTNIWVYEKIASADIKKHDQLIENKVRIINPLIMGV